MKANKIIGLLILLAFSACDDYDIIPEREAFYIASASYGDYQVELYAYDSLFVGYNPLLFKIKNTYNNQISINDWISLEPSLNTPSGTQTCPFENSDGHTHTEHNFYEAAVLFNEVSENWNLEVKIQEQGSSYNHRVPKHKSSLIFYLYQ